MEEILKTSDFYVDCTVGNDVDIYIGSAWFSFGAGPGEKNNYEITVMRKYGDGEEVLSRIQFPLTEEDYEEAWYHSLHDFMYYSEDLDTLMAKRVAQDFFSFCLMSLGNPDGDSMDERVVKEWEEYYKYLLHDRMDEMNNIQSAQSDTKDNVE